LQLQRLESTGHLRAAAPDLPGRFLIRDNEKIYGMKFRNRVDGLGLKQIRTAFRSPWQNGFAERWIRSLRRDWLDHVIAINERQLRRVIRSYVDYYHADRTHLGLEKDTPEERPIEFPEIGEVVAFPRVGGLHHRYARKLRTAAWGEYGSMAMDNPVFTHKTKRRAVFRPRHIPKPR